MLKGDPSRRGPTWGSCHPLPHRLQGAGLLGGTSRTLWGPSVPGPGPGLVPAVLAATSLAPPQPPGPPGSASEQGQNCRASVAPRGGEAVSAELWATSYAGFPRGAGVVVSALLLDGHRVSLEQPTGRKVQPGRQGPGMQLGSSNDPRGGQRGRGGGAASMKGAVPGAPDPTSRLSRPCPPWRPQGPQGLQTTSRAPDRPR